MDPTPIFNIDPSQSMPIPRALPVAWHLQVFQSMQGTDLATELDNDDVPDLVTDTDDDDELVAPAA
jgi:hypothetical protein